MMNVGGNWPFPPAVIDKQDEKPARKAAPRKPSTDAVTTVSGAKLKGMPPFAVDAIAKPKRKTKTRADFEAVEIEKGVPMPFKGARAMGYPWDKLEVGDSFWVEEPWKPSGGMSIHVRANRIFAPKHFISQRAMKDGKQGFRFWRDK